MVQLILGAFGLAVPVFMLGFTLGRGEPIVGWPLIFASQGLISAVWLARQIAARASAVMRHIEKLRSNARY